MFFSGRLYCFEDKRWVALTNRTYGPSYFQFNHSGGVGENPVKDYRAKSPYLKAGTIVDNITVDFRTDDQRIEDIEFYAALQRPWTQTDQITGLSSSNDVQEVIMHKDLLHSPAAAGQIQMSGDLRQNHVRTVPIGATVTKDSILKLAFAPRSTQPLPAILYGYLAITVSLIEPARAISTGTYVAPSPKK